MKTSSRALIGFGIGIAVLVIVTTVLALTLGKDSPALLPENTPQGVVQRYLLAIQEKNYPVAYNYLTSSDTINPNMYKESPLPSYDDWIISAQNTGDSTWKATLGKVTISGNTASVEVIIDHFRPNGPFGNPVYSNTMIFSLKIVASNWLITSPVELYWLY